jgi:long-chain acyl-CoA synthetase
VSGPETPQALRTLWQAAWPAGVARAPRHPIGDVPLTHHLRHWATVQPDAPALYFEGGATTWRQLDRLSDAFARWLAQLGIAPGERVAVFLPNGPQFHWVFYGLLKHGAVHVPVSPMARSFELQHQLADSGAVAVVCHDTLLPLVRRVAAEHPVCAPRHCIVTSGADVARAAEVALGSTRDTAPAPSPADDKDALGLLDGLRAHAGTSPLPLADDADAVAALNYTGGTTGLPKGCIHTQRDMVYTAAANCGVSIDVRPDTVFLNTFLQAWIAGENGGLIFHVFCGRPLVLLPRWDAGQVLQAIERHRVSTFVMTVDSAVELMEHPDFARADLRSLRQPRVVSFMRKLSLEIRQRWRALHPSTLVEAAWGMTETHTSNTFTAGMQGDDFDLRSRPVFIGLPVPGTEIKVCDFDTGADLPPGQEGELCIRTPALFKGYWRQPAATAASLRDGWFRTGDSGLVGAAGHLHYLGRRKEMIKVKGMSVFPMEIETVLGQHPDVAAAGVLPRPDERKGEVPVAFVSLRPGVDKAGAVPALQAWCRDAMASYKLPEIRLLDAMPRTPSGKVDKKPLQALLSECPP